MEKLLNQLTEKFKTFSSMNGGRVKIHVSITDLCNANIPELRKVLQPFGKIANWVQSTDKRTEIILQTAKSSLPILLSDRIFLTKKKEDGSI